MAVQLPKQENFDAAIESFMNFKRAGDSKIAEGLIRFDELTTFRNKDQSSVEQVIHLTLDEAIRQVLQKHNQPIRNLDYQIEIKYKSGSKEIIKTQDNILDRLLSGRRKKKLRKLIEHSMRPHIEELFVGRRFEGKKGYVSVLIREISLNFANGLSDRRLDVDSIENIECVVKEKR